MNKYERSGEFAKKLLGISHKLHGDSLHYFIGALSANISHAVVHNIDDYMNDTSKVIEDLILEAYEQSKKSAIEYGCK